MYYVLSTTPSGRLCLLQNKESPRKSTRPAGRHMRCSHGAWAPLPARIIMHRIHMGPWSPPSRHFEKKSLSVFSLLICLLTAHP